MKKGIVAICLLLISCVMPFSSSDSVQAIEEFKRPEITITAKRHEFYPSIKNPCGFDYSTESAGVELLGKLDCLLEKAS